MDEERKRRNRRKKWKDWLGSWLMILPALCFLLVFTIYPMLNIVRLSFFKGNALKPLKQFVGLDNYRQLFFVKKDFLTALKNTGYYTMMVVVILLTLALLFALWMRAARMDDAGEWKIMLKVALPMCRSSLIATMMFSVIGIWNSYFWPLVMTNSDKFRPLTLYVEKLKQDAEQGLQWNLIMAGNLILVVPILIIYCFGSKQIIKAFTYNGIK